MLRERDFKCQSGQSGEDDDFKDTKVILTGQNARKDLKNSLFSSALRH